MHRWAKRNVALQHKLRQTVQRARIVRKESADAGRRKGEERRSAQGPLRHRRNSAARARAREDARLGDPQGAPRAARQVVPARSGADLADRRGRSAADGDGGRRQLQRRLGRPRPADLHARRAQASVSHRRLRCLRHRLGDRQQGASLEGRRRGHRPLQSGRRRRRGLQRRRSAAVALAAHLGLRDAGRLVRAILPRAVAAIDAQAHAPDLGGVGLLHAHARHRLSHAVRPSAAYAQARRQCAGVGRLRRARRVRRAAGGGLGRQCHRRRLRRVESGIRFQSRRQGRDQPQGIQVLGPDAGGQHRPNTTTGPRKRAASARRSGTSPASATSTSCSSIRASRPSRSRAWW